jgi:hypothetical protein
LANVRNLEPETAAVTGGVFESFGFVPGDDGQIRNSRSGKAGEDPVQDGLAADSSRGLGKCSVRPPSRLPRPAASSTAFRIGSFTGT